MLNLNCAICAEIFAASDDVHCTRCGHMFHFACLNGWLQRSKTCPQCRNNCTDRNVFRVYFNLASSDESRIDVGSLQQQLDSLQHQLEIKESKANELTKSLDDTQKKYTKSIDDHVEKIRMLENQNKETERLREECQEQFEIMHRIDAFLRKTIAGLEKDLKSKNSLIVDHVEKIRMLENQNKEMESLRQVCQTLKEQTETMDGINTILKSQVTVAENKYSEIHTVLEVAQYELRQEIKDKKLLDECISQLQSEKYQILEKIKMLEFQNEAMKRSQEECRALMEVQNEAMKSSQEECRTLKEEIKKMNDINTILGSTISDSEKLLNNERDPNVLSIWITTLRRELLSCESQKSDIRNVLKVAQNDLRKEIEHKKLQDERIAQLEKENFELLEQIINLEAIRNNNNNTTIMSNNSTIGLNTPMQSSFLTNIKEEKRSPKPPTLKDNIKRVEDLIEGLGAKVSRLKSPGTATTLTQLVSNFENNGFESSERVDPSEIVKEATSNDQYKRTAQQ